METKDMSSSRGIAVVGIDASSRETAPAGLANRVALFAIGVGCYLLFLVAFLIAILFLADFGGPFSMDSPIRPQEGIATGIAIDVGLLSVFALQHSIMARRWFKAMWTRIIPAPIERSVYVALSSLALLLLFREWRPIGAPVWDVSDGAWRVAFLAAYALGWIIVLAATFQINHFDLFGLRQVYAHLRGRAPEPIPFRVPLFYQWVRHPLYVGWLVVFWSAPTMSAARLLFALVTTAYILVAIRFEERDLVRQFGRDYRLYQQRVPKLVPFKRGER